MSSAVRPSAATEPWWRRWLARDGVRNGLAWGIGIACGAIMVPTVLWRLPVSSPWVRYVAAYLMVTPIATLLTLVLTWVVFAPLPRARLTGLVRATQSRRRRGLLSRLTYFDDSGLSWGVQGSLVSIIAILLLWFLGERSVPVIVLTMAGVASAWFMGVIAYAVNYLREDVDRPGMVFPGDDEPTFRDYLYQALTVSTSVATSDINVTTRQMRSLVAGNSAVSFFFNTVILAMLISLMMSAR
ncbi:DUF1345 domain-containing protein [Naumannella huperziae]